MQHNSQGDSGKKNTMESQTASNCLNTMGRNSEDRGQTPADSLYGDTARDYTLYCGVRIDKQRSQIQREIGFSRSKTLICWPCQPKRMELPPGREWREGTTVKARSSIALLIVVVSLELQLVVAQWSKFGPRNRPAPFFILRPSSRPYPGAPPPLVQVGSIAPL